MKVRITVEVSAAARRYISNRLGLKRLATRAEMAREMESLLDGDLASGEDEEYNDPETGAEVDDEDPPEARLERQEGPGGLSSGGCATGAVPSRPRR